MGLMELIVVAILAAPGGYHYQHNTQVECWRASRTEIRCEVWTPPSKCYRELSLRLPARGGIHWLRTYCPRAG
jgi:hypothetical protein